MVNFAIQVDSLVLVFMTTQIAAGKIVKSLNETQNELAKSGATDMLAVNSTNHTELTEGRDNYSYYYGRIRLSDDCRPNNCGLFFCSRSMDLAPSALFLALVCVLHHVQRLSIYFRTYS